MIGVSGALFCAVVLLLLILVWMRAEASSRDVPSALDSSQPDGRDGPLTCPPEFVSQIFSGGDMEYISCMKSPELEKLFHRERSAVALLWVRQTSAAIKRIMRQHSEASRLSADLEFATEARIFLQYAQLRLICGALFVLIGLAGPQRLLGVALHAEKLTQRIGEALQEFESGVQVRGMSGAGSS